MEESSENGNRFGIHVKSVSDNFYREALGCRFLFLFFLASSFLTRCRWWRRRGRQTTGRMNVGWLEYVTKRRLKTLNTVFRRRFIFTCLKSHCRRRSVPNQSARSVARRRQEHSAHLCRTRRHRYPTQYRYLSWRRVSTLQGRCR